MFVYFFSLRSPVYFREIEVVVLFCGIMTLVYIGATAFVVFVELPLGTLVGLFFPTKTLSEKKREPLGLKTPVYN